MASGRAKQTGKNGNGQIELHVSRRPQSRASNVIAHALALYNLETTRTVSQTMNMDDLNVCEDEHYLSPADVADLKEQAWRVHRVLNGYMRWLRERKQGAALKLRKDSPAYGWPDHELDKLLDHTIEPPASTL